MHTSDQHEKAGGATSNVFSNKHKMHASSTLLFRTDKHQRQCVIAPSRFHEAHAQLVESQRLDVLTKCHDRSINFDTKSQLARQQPKIWQFSEKALNVCMCQLRLRLSIRAHWDCILEDFHTYVLSL